MKFYNYILLDPRYFGPFKYGDVVFDSEPFYVGKGTGKRWKCHFIPKKMEKDCNTSKINKIKEILDCGFKKEDMVFFYATNIDECDSFKNEIDLISKIKRFEFGGPLLNMTAGGDGASNPSLETRTKMSNSKKGMMIGEKNPMYGKRGELHPRWSTKHTEETKQKMKTNHANVKKENHPQWGTHHKESSKELMAKGHTKYIYKLISPDGIILIVDNMRKFCRDYDCSLPCMLDMVKGKYFQHKGWIGFIMGKEYLRDRYKYDYE